MDLLSIKRSLMPLSGPQDMGGGGGGGTGSQTTTQELPEWARPYAKNTLEKAAAVTETPYQTYGQPRIAGFSPLQQQSQEAAANMQTNQLTGLGGGIAAGAGMGALGAAMSQNPQNFQQQVGGYMNPYLQFSLAPQLAEANRQYDITGTKQQSAATQAGAFGGSREAIMAAENERNRNMGLQNIIGQGYNTAFQNAQNQYNQSQQNQFQGLNAALQGANTLGQLGGQQFQQGMDINKLQNAYGGQQQALRQQGLDLAYQDWQNQQNYPYKQLGFMSDIIRGLPLGQQSAQQMYQAPGSVAGQIAGLGMGAYGLSKFMAEGGLAYANGGVTGYAGNEGSVVRALNDPSTLAAEVDKMSDEQLQQIIQNPSSKAELEAAQEEIAMRASERGGMMGAYNQLPQAQQQGVVQAAGGGILAFAGNEDSDVKDPEKAQREQLKSDRAALGSGLESVGRAAADITSLPIRGVAGAINSALIRPARAISGYEIPYIFGGSPEMTESLTPFYDKMRQREEAESKGETPAADTGKFDRATATRREDFAPTSVDKGKLPAKTQIGISKLAKETGVPEDSLMDNFTKMRNMLRDESKGELEALNKMVDKSAGRSQEIRDKGLAKALTEYGFTWAAKAAEPGARFTGSAAKASPALAASVAKTEELAQAADDNHQKLAMSMKQFELAQRKGDTTAALNWAQQVRQLQQTDKQIAMMREHYAAQAGLGQAQLAQRGEQFKQMMDYRNAAAAAQGLQGAARIADVRRKATVDFDNANRRKEAELIQQYGPIQGKYQYQQLRKNYIDDVLQTSRDQRADMSSGMGGGGAKSVFDLLDES